MTPEDRARVRGKVFQIREIAEDFNRVFLARLLSQNPDLRIRYLLHLSDDGERMCQTLTTMLDALSGDAAFEPAVRSLHNAHRADPGKVFMETRTAMIWAMERCFGGTFDARDTAAFDRFFEEAALLFQELPGGAKRT